MKNKIHVPNHQPVGFFFLAQFQGAISLQADLVPGGFIGGCSKKKSYPLVTNITMENHHFLWENPL